MHLACITGGAAEGRYAGTVIRSMHLACITGGAAEGRYAGTVIRSMHLACITGDGIGRRGAGGGVGRRRVPGAPIRSPMMQATYIGKRQSSCAAAR